MKKRFCKLGRYWLGAVCVVSVCGLTYSCSDDYDLPTTTPSWLGSSIYDYLKDEGDYTNFVRLIDDLDYAEVLAKTGSKTLFVANDSAFNEFYKNNQWGVHSYSELSLAQKKLLLNSVMINNAYLLEMMSSVEGPVKGQCLRRETAVAVTDSVTHLSSEQLPTTYNEEDKDYWARFRDPNKGGIWIAMDNTVPMMTHFLPAQMSNNNITDMDFEYVVGKTRDKNDAFIYGSKVVEQDITCQNGYINRLDQVLITPPNIAEMLRTNGHTNIFSHMVDRFSAPFYNESLTKAYQLLYGNTVDSVFQKRYFSKVSQGGGALSSDAGTDPIGNPSGNAVAYALNYDPGWNTYMASEGKTPKEQDMAAVFAPSDNKLYEYFFAENGGGRFLLEAYAPDLIGSVRGETDYENIYRCIDQIPLDVIQALINNLMKDSFCNSVPSKFETIKDDAQDPMLDETHYQYIDTVLLANNGAIYVMDEVLTPAKYAAVSAPALVAEDMHIFNWALNQVQLNSIKVDFYAYLLAMSSRLSFFVPKDDFYYVDPVSFAWGIGNQRVLYYTWDKATSKVKCTAYDYDYDFATGTGVIGEPQATTTVSTGEYEDRLADMLQTHTIVHSDNTKTQGIDETSTGIECDKNYFIAKNGAPIYVKDATKRENGCMVRGAWLSAGEEMAKVIRFDDKTEETNGNGNGMAYEIDKPMQPAIESVFSTLYNNPEFKNFYDLCQTDIEVLEELGLTKSTEQRRYEIFVNDNGLPCYDKTNGSLVSSATNVRFFNNYRYTVYVPTNDAIQEAIDKGLPTWERIREFIEKMKADETVDEEEWKEQGLAMVSALINFLKYHFQDETVYADIPALKEDADGYETATLNSATGTYMKLYVSSTGNGTLQVRDAVNQTRTITSNNNLMTRDYVLNASGTSARTISASSFAVVHGIDGVLNYKELEGGRYDSDWSTPTAAKKYLAKYRIIE